MIVGRPVGQIIQIFDQTNKVDGVTLDQITDFLSSFHVKWKREKKGFKNAGWHLAVVDSQNAKGRTHGILIHIDDLWNMRVFDPAAIDQNRHKIDGSTIGKVWHLIRVWPKNADPEPERKLSDPMNDPMLR